MLSIGIEHRSHCRVAQTTLKDAHGQLCVGTRPERAPRTNQRRRIGLACRFPTRRAGRKIRHLQQAAFLRACNGHDDEIDRQVTSIGNLPYGQSGFHVAGHVHDDIPRRTATPLRPRPLVGMPSASRAQPMPGHVTTPIATVGRLQQPARMPPQGSGIPIARPLSCRIAVAVPPPSPDTACTRA